MISMFGTPPAWASGFTGNRRQALPNVPYLGVLRGEKKQAFNLPQLGNVPSIQSWNRLAPSEQQGAMGYWEDELGVHAPDVAFTMNRLAPRTGFKFAPKWSGF